MTRLPKQGMLSWTALNQYDSAWVMAVWPADIRSLGLFSAPTVIKQLQAIGITGIAVGYNDDGMSFYVLGVGADRSQEILQLLSQHYSAHPMLGRIIWSLTA